MTDKNYTAKIDRDNGLTVTSNEYEPIVKCMADIKARQVSWLWENRIPAGRITLLAGTPGLGKSFITCDLASRITNGTPFPDGAECVQGSVMLIACEDDPADTIRPRLDANGADPTKVHLLEGVILKSKTKDKESMFTLSDVEILEKALARIPDCKLIVIDPIGSYLGGGTKANSDNEVRAVLAPIAKIAAETGVAVLIVAHTRKAEATHADDMVMGSRAFTGIARSVLHLMEDPDDCDRRLLLPGKCNITSRQNGLSFAIAGHPATIHWSDQPEDRTANEVLASLSGKRKAGGKNEEVENWLKHQLRDGPKAQNKIFEAAKSEGFSTKAIYKARKAIKADSKAGEFGGPWAWSLPSRSPVSAATTDTAETANTAKTDNTEATVLPVSSVLPASEPARDGVKTEDGIVKESF